MRKTIKIAVAFALACLGGLMVWNYAPNASAPFAPDPAVAYANKTFQTEIPYREDYFEHEGNTLHYVEAGEGPLVILVHGFPAYWYAMIRQMEALKSTYRVVAIDTLGAGRSDAPQDVTNYTLDARSKQLNALIEHLSPNGKVHLIGHDWGGAYMYGFAQKHPEKVASVTGIAAPPHTVFLNLLETDEKQQETSSYVEKLNKANPVLLLALRAPQKVWKGAYEPLLDGDHINAEESEIIRKNFRSPKRINAYLNWYRANVPPVGEIADTDYWPSKDAKFEMPVLIIRGLDDDVFVPEYVHMTRALAPDATVLELENTGHWPHMEATERVNETILDFINNHSAEEY